MNSGSWCPFWFDNYYQFTGIDVKKAIHSRIIAIIVGSVLVIIGIAVLILAVISGLNTLEHNKIQRDAVNWPTTSGRITSNELEQTAFGDWGVWLRYGYVVDRVYYVG